jgi:hypothetical protein
VSPGAPLDGPRRGRVLTNAEAASAAVADHGARLDRELVFWYLALKARSLAKALAGNTHLYPLMDSNAVSAYAAIVSAATTIVLACLTGWYVRLTGRMVSEMRAARQPIVFLDLEIRDNVNVILIIGNSGDAPARHIRFDVDDGIPWSHKPWFAPAELPALRDGIPYLAPGRTLRFGLGPLDWKTATTKSGWLNVKITFEGEEGRRFVHPANIDLARYNGLSADTFSNHPGAVVEALRGILQVSIETAEREKPNSFTKWCPACAHPMSNSAKKCADCGEWLPGANPVAPASQDPSPAG